MAHVVIYHTTVTLSFRVSLSSTHTYTYPHKNTCTCMLSAVGYWGHPNCISLSGPTWHFVSKFRIRVWPTIKHRERRQEMCSLSCIFHRLLEWEGKGCTILFIYTLVQGKKIYCFYQQLPELSHRPSYNCCCDERNKRSFPPECTHAFFLKENRDWHKCSKWAKLWQV